MKSDFESNQGVFSLSSGLFSQIRDDILHQKLKPGEKLTEQRIGAEYAVSRTPVREAFKQLEVEGLIENIPNRGAFVVGFSQQDIDDIYELRKVYEIIAVRWAIQRITKQELEELWEAYEFMEFYTHKRDYGKMLNINSKFHVLIYKASHNHLLCQTLTSYQYYIQQTRELPLDADTYLDEVLKEHRQILEAFQFKNIETGVSL
jgi:DNA-binding GntR family transcriptional regulator